MKFLFQALAERPVLKKIISNVSWLFAGRIVQQTTRFLIGIWFIRYLGPEQFGLFSYAIAFVGIFEPLANLGFDQLIIRDLVKNNRQVEEQEKILSTVFFFKFFGSLLSIILACSIILMLRPDSVISQALIFIMSITLLFKTFDVLEIWFHSKIQAKYVVFAEIISLILTSTARIILIVWKAPLIAFGILFLVEIIIIKLALLSIYLFREKNYLHLGFLGFNKIKAMLQDSLLLIVSGVAIVIYMRIDQIMLGQMVGDRAVGFYSAAVKLAESWYIFPLAIGNSSLPVLIEYRQRGKAIYYQKLHQLFRLIVILGYGLGIFFTIFSAPIVHFLFGPEYRSTALVLPLSIWSALFVGLGIIRNLWITAENRTGFACFSTVSGALLNIILNLILIPKYAELGAIIATFISYVVSSYALGFFFKQSRPVTRIMTKALLLQ